jgi:4-amino-4-deoxy-L-arabinose transferase-like glycosyltransferase
MRLLGDLGTRTPPGAVDVITEPDLTLPDPGPVPVTPAPARDRAAGRRGRLRSTGLPLTAILVLAALLRFWHLAATGFNSDESVYTGSASSLAGDGTLHSMFPVFRAHPLLFQVLLSLVLRIHETDFAARAFAAAIGVAAVAVTFLLGSRLYGRRAGLLAALLLAVMPYHVIVSRQVLLDGLMTLCATAALYCVARYCDGCGPRWLLAAAGLMGASILTKETSLVLLAALYAFFALSRPVPARWRHILLALGVTGAEVIAWPLALRASGQAKTGQSYLLWQLFRRPNHGPWFYVTVLPSWIGPAVLIAALIGLIRLRRDATWREPLLLAWVIVPVLFFTLWPVKGFEYLLPVAPALAVLAGRALSRPSIWVPRAWRAADRLARATSRWPWLPRSAMSALVVISAVSLAVPSWDRIQPSATSTYLAGTGGVTGGRQAGEWILRTVPPGARLLAIGPSMANILEFYGHHQVSALSVSPDPRNRNPSYVPVPNADLALRQGDFQYVVWDSYSAARSPLFARHARSLVSKFHGVAVFTATITARGRRGNDVAEPVIVIYEVHPG